MRAIERAGYLAHARTAGFARRRAEARECVREMLSRCRRPYIGYSTGKDSTCAANLVWEQDPSVPGVYFDANCAYPESYALIDRMIAAGHPICKWPCEDFLDTLEAFGGVMESDVRLGPATMESTVYEPVRRLIEARGYDGVALGLRAEESKPRLLCIRARGLLFDNKRDGVLECLPVGHWSDVDVWAYIVSTGADYNAAYDAMEGIPWRERRISYWAGETNRGLGRWSWLRARYPDLWAKLCERFPDAVRFT